MSLFGALVRTAVNIAALPVAIVQDAATLGGAVTDRDSYAVEAIERLKREAETNQEKPR